MTVPPRPDGPDVQLNLNVRGLAQSATVAINERSDELRRAGKRVYKLGLGQSPFPVPPAVVAALQEHAAEKDYLPTRGLPALREAVAHYHCPGFGFERSPEDVLVGPGSKELMFVLQLVYYGDLVIPTPTWVSYAPQAQIIGRQVRLAPTRFEDGWRLQAEQLDRVCRGDPARPRIVILNYPANPTGGTYSVDELEALAAVARRYRVILLSDEIYGKLHHAGAHHSIVPLYPEGTIFSSGLSKWCGAGGWRLGMFVFPENLRWLQDAMTVVASETFTATSAPIQYAAVRAFQEGPEIAEYLERSCRILRALGRRLAARLTQAGARLPAPEGAFYLYPDFGVHAESLARRGIRSGPELAERLLEETGVATLPACAFGRPDHELTLRLAYVNFDGAAALEALAAEPPGTDPDETFLQRWCGGALEAVDRLCTWMHD